MARTVQPVDILPDPCSSDDETQGSYDGSSTDDDDQHGPHPQKSQEEEDSDDERVAVVKKSSLQEETQESDDDSGETQKSPSVSAFIVKPIVAKPVLKSPQPETPTSKPTKSRAKRPADSKEIDKPSKPKGGNSKRRLDVDKIDKVVSKNKKTKLSNGDGQIVRKVDKGKKVVSGDEESGEVDEKKSVIKWSEIDEIALLGGIIDYNTNKGDDVNSTKDTSYEYVKDLLSVDVSKSQLYEKVRRLKKKFQTNLEKWQSGEEPVFSRPHENKLFELSKKIWDSEGVVTEGNDSKVKSSHKKHKKDGIVVSNANTSRPLKLDTNRELFVQEEVKDTTLEDKKEETQDYWLLYPRLCASLESEASGYLTMTMIRDIKKYVKEIISKMGEDKARELEDRWIAINRMDRQLYVKRAHLISKQAEALVD